jgi:predicted RNA-binding Zn-ribbon protein involved in translation (DUF1610 family)
MRRTVPHGAIVSNRVIQRRPTRCLLKWPAAALSLGLFVAWHFAACAKDSVLITPGTTPPQQAALSHGCIVWVFARPASGGTGLFGAYHLRSELGAPYDPGLHLPRVEQMSGIASTVVIPLWIPLVLSLAVAALLGKVDHSRPEPGRCAACGYDLTLNVSGRCPECGVVFIAGSIAQRSGEQV